MYLGETFGTDQLYPGLGPQRGVAMKWIVWTNVMLAEAGGRLAAALPAGVAGAVEEGSVDWVSKTEEEGEEEKEQRRSYEKRGEEMAKAKGDLER